METTRYRGAAALCEAIRAAANAAPEIDPRKEFPGRYPGQLYPFTVPDEYETGAVFYMPVRGAASIEILTDGPACKWPRCHVHPEAPGPFLPTRSDARVTFAYTVPDGARGSLTVENVRAPLLALADKVHAARAAFDGAPRLAPRLPSKPRSGSAPHVAVRALWSERDYAGSLALAMNLGAVYFGKSPKTSPGAFPYMSAEPVDAAGHGFTIARSIQTGRFRVLHSRSGLAVDSAAPGVREGFTSYSSALDWLETSAACDAWRAKLDAAAAKTADFDQSAALAHYMGTADAAPMAAIEAPARAIEPAATVAPVAPIDAPTGPQSEPMPDAAEVARILAKALHAAGVNGGNAATPSRLHEAAEWARQRGARLESGANGFARSESVRLRAAACNHAAAAAELKARASAEPAAAPGAVAVCAAACTLERITATYAHDSARRAAIEAGRIGTPGAGASIARYLERIAEHGRGNERTEARAALAALAADTAPGFKVASIHDAPGFVPEAAPAAVPPTYAIPGPLPTQSAAQAEAPALEFVSRWSGGRGDGLSEVSARIECAKLAKTEPGFVFKVAPCDGAGLYAWQAAAMRGKFEVQRWRAVAGPLPTQSHAPAEPAAPHAAIPPTTQSERVSKIVSEVFERMQHRTPYHHQPQFARIAIERLGADSTLRTSAKLDELLDAYARTYGVECSPAERDSAHYTCSRRFYDFPGFPAPVDPLPTQSEAAPEPAASAPTCSTPLAMLRHHVSGAIARGEAAPIVEMRAEAAPATPVPTQSAPLPPATQSAFLAKLIEAARDCAANDPRPTVGLQLQAAELRKRAAGMRANVASGAAAPDMLAAWARNAPDCEAAAAYCAALAASLPTPPAPTREHAAFEGYGISRVSAWADIERGDAEPDEYRAHVLECLAEVKASGGFYNADIWPRTAALMAHRYGYPDARDDGRPHGPDAACAREFGSHCYMAGKVLNQRAYAAMNREAANGLHIGQKFARLRLQDGATCTSAVLVSLTHTGQCKLTAKRGAARVELTCDAYALKCSIERAAERAELLAQRRAERKPARVAPLPTQPAAEPAPEPTRVRPSPPPSLRIPGTDPRARIPARFAPVYLLRG